MNWYKTAQYEWKEMNTKSEIEGVDIWWIGDSEEYIEAGKDASGLITYEVVSRKGRSSLNKVFDDLESAKIYYKKIVSQEGEF